MNKMTDLFKNVTGKVCIRRLWLAQILWAIYWISIGRGRCILGWFKKMPAVTDCFKTQKICDDAVRRDPYYLPFIPDNLKTQVMCEKVVKDNLWNVEYVPEHLKTKTKEMCEKAVKDGPWSLRYVSEHLKTKEMCKKVVRDGPWHLEYVPLTAIEPWILVYR